MKIVIYLALLCFLIQSNIKFVDDLHKELSKIQINN